MDTDIDAARVAIIDPGQVNVWDMGFLRIAVPQSAKPKVIPMAVFKPRNAVRHSDYVQFRHGVFLTMLAEYSIQAQPTDEHTLIYYCVNGTQCDLLDKGGFLCALGDWALRPLPLRGMSALDVTLRSKSQPTEKTNSNYKGNAIIATKAQHIAAMKALAMGIIPSEQQEGQQKRRHDLIDLPSDDDHNEDLQPAQPTAKPRRKTARRKL